MPQENAVPTVNLSSEKATDAYAGRSSEPGVTFALGVAESRLGNGPRALHLETSTRDPFRAANQRLHPTRAAEACGPVATEQRGPGG